MREGLLVDEQPTQEDADFVANQLEAFNTRHWPDHLPWRELAIYRREAGRITAALIGNCYAGQMFVKYLWVGDGLRGQGLGRALLAEAEAKAASWGCHLIWLDTFTFQAPGFYRRCGFEQFAALATPPYERILFSKRLAVTRQACHSENRHPSASPS